jgi:A/G-specific adenine glycosylase
MSNKELTAIPGLALDWFDVHARALPWRVSPADRAKGKRPDPYRVWLCEIMMQQTTIPHGTPYFLNFTERWPNVQALAAAPDEAVMAAWAGLGYYARARNLVKCAREVAALGGFPDTAKALQKLPGIGPYTAGAIAAIAFNRPAAAVDGNVDRVFARLMALKGDWKSEKKHLAQTVQSLVPDSRPGDFAEALMDIGATVCTPKRPNCAACPFRNVCQAHAEGAPETYPIKPKKADRPSRLGIVYVALSGGSVWLERRPEKGLLGGMLGLPTTDWTSKPSVAKPPIAANWSSMGEVRHVFTHFSLTLDVQVAQIDVQNPNGVWVPVEQVTGLPSVFAKAFHLAVKA